MTIYNFNFRATQRLSGTIGNQIFHPEQIQHLIAYARELAGEVVATKTDGSPFDHIDEVDNVIRGYKNRIDELKDLLADPNLSAAERSQIESLLGQRSKDLDNIEIRLNNFIDEHADK